MFDQHHKIQINRLKVRSTDQAKSFSFRCNLRCTCQVIVTVGAEVNIEQGE